MQLHINININLKLKTLTDFKYYWTKYTILKSKINYIPYTYIYYKKKKTNDY